MGYRIVDIVLLSIIILSFKATAANKSYAVYRSEILIIVGVYSRIPACRQAGFCPKDSFGE